MFMLAYCPGDNAAKKSVGRLPGLYALSREYGA